MIYFDEGRMFEQIVVVGPMTREESKRLVNAVGGAFILQEGGPTAALLSSELTTASGLTPGETYSVDDLQFKKLFPTFQHRRRSRLQASDLANLTPTQSKEPQP